MDRILRVSEVLQVLAVTALVGLGLAPSFLHARLTIYVVLFKELLQKQALLSLEPKSASDCFP